MPTLNVYRASLAAICTHSFYPGVRLALAVLSLKLTRAPATLGVNMMAYALLPALLSLVLGACLGLAQPMTLSLLHQSVPEHRVGEALGARVVLLRRFNACRRRLAIRLGVADEDITHGVLAGSLR